MSEDYLIRNCAPTLAGIKTGSMFTCPFQSKEILLDSIRNINKRLSGKGLRLLPLRFSEKKALIYLYRPAKLRQDLSQDAACALLQKQGYPTESCEKCIVQLVKKLQLQEDFPHEIGLFLGYPAEDVHGFMEKGPECCKASGCWKVYGDEAAAQKLFSQYKKCSRIYRECWNSGRPIECLAVASRA